MEAESESGDEVFTFAELDIASAPIERVPNVVHMEVRARSAGD